MYKGFNLELSETLLTLIGLENDMFETGKELQEYHAKYVNYSLEQYLSQDSILDGTRIQNDWFPEIEADIFISHSHKDERSAIVLAGYLSARFGLKAFVDSCIWGNSEELLWKIDNAYCLNEGGETFSYEKRNFSTSHVHMILSTALTKMIDKSECLFFLNTPNSLKTSDIKTKTNSPWIYSEIATSSLIRKRIPQRNQYFSESQRHDFVQKMLKSSFTMEYELPVDHLEDLDEKLWNRWENSYSAGRGEHALDTLYRISNQWRRFYEQNKAH